MYIQLDRDRDDLIPTPELREAVEHSAYSFGLTSEQAAELLYDVDANGDRYVDFMEFSRLVRSLFTISRDGCWETAFQKWTLQF